MHICDYSILQWQELYNNRQRIYFGQFAYLHIISEHIQHLLYMNSLRYIWINACITI